MKHLRKFLSMLVIEFPDDTPLQALMGPQWIIGFACALAADGNLAKIFAMEITGPKFGWGRRFLTNLKHLVEYARINAIAGRFNADRETIEDLQVNSDGYTRV